MCPQRCCRGPPVPVCDLNPSITDQTIGEPDMSEMFQLVGKFLMSIGALIIIVPCLLGLIFVFFAIVASIFQ